MKERGGDVLLVYFCLRYSLGPNTAIRVFQLLHEFAGVVLVVFVDYDVGF